MHPAHSRDLAQLPEDRRFFIIQYLRTIPLSGLSVIISALTWGMWVLLDNAPMLGFFSLGSTISSICQQSALVGSIAQTILPNAHDREHQAAIVQTSWRIDSLIISVALIGTYGFFLATGASIMKNLGLLTFFATGLLTLAEPFPSLTIALANAKRLYGWTFLMNNCRNMLIIVCLGVFYVMHGPPQMGIAIWVFSVLFAFAIASLFFYRRGINPMGKSPQRLVEGFRRNIYKIFLGLAVYRAGVLLFASLPSLLVAFIHGSREIGLFSFALSLSGFLYSAISPVNEQVYSPSFSKLVHADHGATLLRRIWQLVGITFLLAVPCAILIDMKGEWVLALLHKASFMGSFSFLPALLAYRILIMATSGFTNSLFCMNRFRALGWFYYAAAASGGMWYWLFKSSFANAVWCLPVSVMCLGGLSGSYVVWLVWKKKTLLRRSMYSIS